MTTPALTMKQHRGELRIDEPLSRHTVWGIGGPAKRFYRPAGIADLAEFLAGLPEGEPVFWLGLGSNVLVRDGGVDGTVIVTDRLDGVEVIEGTRVRVETGVACPKLAKFCAAHRLTGSEFFAGIPGSRSRRRKRRRSSPRRHRPIRECLQKTHCRSTGARRRISQA